MEKAAKNEGTRGQLLCVCSHPVGNDEAVAVVFNLGCAWESPGE